jgi:peptide/nickel transport system ATP-binding protein
MYAGKVMERGGVFDIFERPAHPYTQALLRCLPGNGEVTTGIPGTLPDPTDPPDGCRFAPRCEHATGDCRRAGQPETVEIGTDHGVSCVYYRSDYDSSVVRDAQLQSEESSSRGETYR